MLEEKLEQRKIKPTSMRILVLQELVECHSAISLSDLEARFERADKATLYRTLKTFVESELAHKIDDGTGITKYALCEENCHCEIETDLHLHFHCKLCNETSCLTDHKIPNISLPKNFIAEDVNLVVKGICNKCNSN